MFREAGSSPNQGGGASIEGAQTKEDARVAHLGKVIAFHEQEIGDAIHRGDMIEDPADGIMRREGMPDIMVIMHHRGIQGARLALEALNDTAPTVTDTPEAPEPTASERVPVAA